MHAGNRVLVAVSGGADSVALLRVLLELRSDLGIVLAVAHFNHRLRGEQSNADQHFVAELARQHQVEFFAGEGDVRDHAAGEKLGIEAAGRKLRYRWLALTAANQKYDVVATAHTRDDQVETVLLKFLRGAGTKGVAGIYPEMLAGESHIRFVRPLLEISRAQIESYLSGIGQPWREDESNLDRRFYRNRVRHELLPLLEREYNPNLRQVLWEAAEISREEETYWTSLLASARETRFLGQHRFRLEGFDQLHLAVQRRILKSFLEAEGVAVDFERIEVLRQVATGATSSAMLTGDWTAKRSGDLVELLRPVADPPITDYEYQVAVPGEICLSAVNARLRVVPVPAAFAAEATPGTLLAASLLGSELSVRNWKPGDRYRPAYSGSEQKLKRLFNEHKIPADKRPSWPVALKGFEVVWVRGLPVAEAYCWRPGVGDAIGIELVADSPR